MSLWSWLTTENSRESSESPKIPRRRLRMGRLEDRVLMNATAMPSATDGATVSANDQPQQLQPAADDVQLPPPDMIICDGPLSIDLDTSEIAAAHDQTVTLHDVAPSPTAELVVVDSQINDLSTLLAQLADQAQQRHFDILKIEANQDGVQAIANAVAGHQYAAIHILTHGNDGSVQLGDQWLRADNLSTVANEIAHWGDGLTADGDILFYGCNIAASSSGQELLTAVANLTHADVAASTDLTGHQAFGGDWNLEFSTGLVSAGVAIDPAAQQAWHDLLAATSFQEGTNSYAGTVDTFIESDKPTTDNSTVSKLPVDASPVNQVLIRFDNIFGSGAGQIPWGSTITSASLTVDVEKASVAGAQVELHRVLVPWTDTSNWSTLTRGISTNNIDAITVAESTITDPTAKNANTFTGVTGSLQAWSDGQDNYGWVITNNNIDDWKMRSSEDASAALRPLLSVTYTPPSIDPLPEQLINTTTANTQETDLHNRGASEAVAMANSGDYVVVWSSQNQDGSGWGVYGQRYDTHGVKQGSEFLVNQTTAGDQRWANVASDGEGNFVVTWTSFNQDGTTESVYARQFDSSGTALGNEFRVNTTNTGIQDDAVITMDRQTGDFVIAWEGEGPGDTDGIFFRRFAADGTPNDATDRIAHAADGTSQNDPAITYTINGEFVIAWEQSNKVYFQRFDATGAMAGSRTQIDNLLSSSVGIAIAADDAGDFTVVYRETTILPGIWGRGFHADGSSNYTWFQVSSGDGISPSIDVAGDGSFVVTYHQSTDGDGTGIFARKYTAAGSAVANAFQVNQDITGTQHNASLAALNTDNFVVVWSGQGPADSTGIYARQFGLNADPVITSNAGGATAAINVAENSTAVTTVTATDSDLPAQALSYMIVGGADASLFSINTSSGALQFVAAPDFETKVDANTDGIYQVIVEARDTLGGFDMQTINVTVTNVNEAPIAVDDSYSLNTDAILTVPVKGVMTNDTDDSPSLTASVVSGPTHASSFTLNSDGSFSYRATANYYGTDTFTYRVSDGSLNSNTATVTLSVNHVALTSTSETRVNTNTTDIQETIADGRGSHRAIEILPSGDYVVVWSSLNQDGGGWGVYGQRFSRTGGTIGSEFRVNQVTASNQDWATVAVSNNGQFVVSWTSENQDGTSHSIYARLYDASGTAIGNEFKVNTDTGAVQKNGSVDMDANGNFVIVWEGTGPGDTDGIFARRFNSAGVALNATEILVNVDLARPHYDPIVSMNDSGAFAVEWDDAVGVIVRRYDSSGTALGGEIVVSNDFTSGDGSIALANDGSFVSVWRQTVGGARDAFLRRYDSSGTALSGPTTISVTTAGDQTNPSIAMDSAGNFVIAWEGNGTGDADGIFYRKYAANGTAMSTEQRINTTTTGVQNEVSVAMLDLQSFVTVWSGNGPGDSAGVFVRQFNFPNAAPVIAIADSDISYTENAVPRVIDSTLTITDADSSSLNGATVQFQSGFAAGQDVLSFTPVAGISGNYNSATGVLTFTGNTSLANYQTVLRSVAYANSSDNPSTTARVLLFTVDDGIDVNTDSRIVQVTAVNDAPVGVADSYSTNEDTLLSVAASGVLGNDSDVDSVNLIAVLVAGPTQAASFTLNANGSFNYTPTANYSGTDSFTYRVSDGLTSSAITTVNLTVNAVNDAPVNVLQATTVSTNEDTNLVFNALNGNRIGVSDVDAGGNSIQMTLQVGSGDLTLATTAGLTFITGDGTQDATITATGTMASWNTALSGMTFRPVPNFNGNVTLTVTSNDRGFTGNGGAKSDVDTVTITVNPVNDAPVATAEGYTTLEDTPLIRPAAQGVLANDTDIDSATLTAVLVSGPSNAAAFTLNANGSFSYTPGANYNGVDSFTYRAFDGAASSAVTTVTLNIGAINDAPVNDIQARNVSTNEDTNLVFDLANGNQINIADVDAGGNDVQVSLQVSGGDLTLSQTAGLTFVTGDGTQDTVITATGTIASWNAALNGMIFTPTPTFNGSVTLTVTSNDLGFSGVGGAKSDTDTINITVVPVNDSPVSVAESYNGTEDTILTVSAAQGVLINDSDSDSPSLTAVLVSGPSKAAAFTLNADGSFTYTPSANSNGVDTFTYRASDGNSQSALTTVTLNVAPVNDAPQANADTFTFSYTQGQTLSGSAFANDTDVDRDPLVGNLVVRPTHGTIVWNSNGTFVYTPSSNFSGIDTFTYSVFDPTGAQSQATVTIVAAFIPPNDSSSNSSSSSSSGSSSSSSSSNSNSNSNSGSSSSSSGNSGGSNNGSSNGSSSGGSSSNSDNLIGGLTPVITTITDNHQTEKNDTTVSNDAANSALLIQFSQSKGDDSNSLSKRERNRGVGDTLSDTRDSRSLNTLPEFDYFGSEYRLQDQLPLFRNLEEMDQLVRERERGRFVGAVSATLFSSGLSIGYVMWLLRGGLLLSSLLAQLPAWRVIDPLMVLNLQDKRGNGEEDESLQTIIENNSLAKTSTPPSKNELPEESKDQVEG